MKVTVSFGSVRVIVPCGDGSLLVRELIDRSVVRYRKAAGKPLDYWIHVHTLKLSRDDGILDPDDQLIDVADDREQIIAYFDEQCAPSIPHNGGDGTSASSAGTASPDIFQGGIDLREKGFRPMYSHRHHPNDVVITHDDLNLGTNLTVRRGSEPSLNKIGTSDDVQLRNKQGGNNTLPKDKEKRWSALAAIDDSQGATDFARDVVYSDSETSGDQSPTRTGSGRVGQDDGFQAFSRGSSRKSLGNMPGMYKWLDAQERQEEKYHEFHNFRKDPVGGHVTENTSNKQMVDNTVTIVMKNESGPLGIHVVPYYDENERDAGLVIQGIEPGGRIHREGMLEVQDRIIEINKISLINVGFTRAQEIFKNALQTAEIELLVNKHPANVKAQKKPAKLPPPTPPKPDMKKLHLSINKAMDINENISPPSEISHNGALSQPHQQVAPTHSSHISQPSTNSQSPESKGAPPPVPNCDPDTSLSNNVRDRQIITNTKRIGKKVKIQLTKGTEGLGFSITTRDNPAGGSSPIYVKNVLPKGAAIKDGRLKPGDRLLEVNGVDLSDKTQSDAVALLRNAKLGSTVDILVSRQEVIDQFAVPRQLDSSLQTSDHWIETDDEQPSRETLMLDIPLNETGSAGLGVSVKGKTQKRDGGDPIDLGIFVKSVMNGGAASKDGRLRINDQLVRVNGLSLIGKTNAQSMDALRKAMQMDGPIPGYIQLVVSRKIGAPTPTPEAGGTFSYEHLGYDNKSPSYTDHDSSRDERTFANSDAYSNSQLSHQNMDSDRQREPSDEHVVSDRPKLNEPVTIVAQTDNSVLIEEDSYPKKFQKPRPHSTIGFIRPTPPDTPSSTSSQNTDDGEGQRRKLSEGDRSLDDMVLFQREGFGRQSMSEKRRGHIDAKQMEFYQKLKGGKEKDSEEKEVEKEEEIFHPTKTESNQKPEHTERMDTADHNPNHENEADDIGPTLGMKKSSSLESLQAMIKEVEDEDDGALWHGPSGVVRGRGCNDSFRAAVDRSYDGPHVTVETMDPLEEEESENASSQGRRSGMDSNRSSVSIEGQADPQVTNKGKGKPVKEKEKKGGLFKGLFKFGQKRKTVENRSPSKGHLKGKGSESSVPESAAQQRARLAAQEEQEKIQEHYRRLQEKQRQIEQKEEQYDGNHALTREVYGGIPLTREERIQQLRAEHQRKHLERHGRYPHEDREEMLDRELREIEEKRRVDSSHKNKHNYGQPAHWTSNNASQSQVYDGRPSSTAIDMDLRGHYQHHTEINDYGAQYKHQPAKQKRQSMGDRAFQPQHGGNYSQGSQNGREKTRSATPINAMGYMSHYNRKKYVGTLSAGLPNERGNSYDFDYDDPSNAYHEPTYAVVQRKGNREPAQV